MTAKERKPADVCNIPPGNWKPVYATVFYQLEKLIADPEAEIARVTGRAVSIIDHQLRKQVDLFRSKPQ